MILLALACARTPPPQAAAEIPEPVSAARPLMGTRVAFTAMGADVLTAERAFGEAFAEFERIEALASEWRPGSPLTAVNEAAGVAPVLVPDELLDLVVRALDFAERTEGAFDPTFAAMWGLWTFGDDGVNTLPDAEEVSRRLPLVDWRAVQVDVDAGTVYLPEEGMKLGLGGIAKGWATDRAVAILKSHQLQHFVVQAGGELYVAGEGAQGAWRVGVRDPRGDGPFAWLPLTDAAFDTSGDYERFFEADGSRYHHIVDPETGWPATRCRSATVLAPDALTADALSTGLFVLGPERGIPLVEAWPGVDALWVTADNQVRATSGLADRVEFIHDPTP